MGSDEGIAVGDVLLPASALPFSVFLGIVLTVELPEGDCLDVFLIPAVKFLDTVLVFVSFVVCGFRNHNTSHKADAYKGTDTYNNREIELAQILQPDEITIKKVSVIFAKVRFNACRHIVLSCFDAFVASIHSSLSLTKYRYNLSRVSDVPHRSVICRNWFYRLLWRYSGKRKGAQTERINYYFNL